MRLFAQLGWFFRREWRHYLGAVMLLIIIALLQLVPPRLVGIIIDSVVAGQATGRQLALWLVMGCSVLLVMSLQISWQLTLLALLPMPVMAVIIKRDGQRLHQRFRVAQSALSSLNNQAQENLASIRMIKAFGLEQHQSARFAAVALEAGDKNMHVARVDTRFDPTIYLTVGLANLLAVGGGSWL